MNYFDKFYKKIDFLDIIGFGILVAIVIILVSFFLGKGDEVYITLRVSQSENLAKPWYVSNESPLWYIQNIKTGLAEKDVLGRSNIEVTDVYYYPTLNPNQTVFIQLKIKTKFDKQKKQHSFAGQPILIGSSQEFKLEKMLISGVVQKINDSPIERIEKKFVVKGFLENQYNESHSYSAETIFEGIRSFVADNIYQGMEVTDSKGNVIAKVLNVTKTTASREFISEGKLISTVDSERTNVDLELLLTAFEISEGMYQYKEENLLILNGGISLNFEDFEVWMTINEIEEYQSEEQLAK